MRIRKSILLIAVVTVLISVSLYFVYVISDGSNPLVTLNLIASEEDDTLERELEELNSVLTQVDNGDPPTPTVTYNSTSPTLTPTNSPGGATTPSGTVTPTISITPTTSTAPVATATLTIAPTANVTVTSRPTPLVSPTTAVIYVTSTPIPVPTITQPVPTIVRSLPTAGVADIIPPYLLGGALLVLVAFIL